MQNAMQSFWHSSKAATKHEGHVNSLPVEMRPLVALSGLRPCRSEHCRLSRASPRNSIVLNRPNYYLGTHFAAEQAKALGIRRISCVEFGVAGGNGLLALERVAALVQNRTGVRIDVYGFDTGVGLPQAQGWRDAPYAFGAGQFHMDETRLRAQLTTARLTLGPVNETIPRVAPRFAHAPLGFVSVDVDYYSSTMDIMRTAFSLPFESMLPRLMIYFDDVDGNGQELYTEHLGERLAIADFNRARNDRKIGYLHNGYMFYACKDLLRGFGSSDELAERSCRTCQNIFVMHGFEHPLYSRPVRANAQLPLKF